MELDRVFLKKLWDGDEVVCPNCNKAVLVPLHKKRRDNNDWRCPECDKVYRTFSIFYDILNSEK